MYSYASIWGCSSRSDGVPLLKFAHSFDPYGWIHVLVHGLGFYRHFKGWMGEVRKRELAGWFFGHSGGVWGPFFFQAASLDARSAMVGSDHPFDGRIGRLVRKGVLGHNLGLGARKRLASTPIVLKWWKPSRVRKPKKIDDDRLQRLIADDWGIRSMIGRSGWKWEGRNLLARQVRT